MDADSSFIVTKVIPALSVPSGSVQEWALVALGAEACSLVILRAVDIWTVVEGAIPSADGTAATLVHKVPVEAGIGPMLCAFVLHEEWALLCAEFLQVRVVLRFLGLCLQHLSGSGRGRRGSCRAAGPGALRHGPVFLPLRRSPFIIQSARSAPKTHSACAAPREREDPPHSSKGCWELWSSFPVKFYRWHSVAAKVQDHNTQRSLRTVSRMLRIRNALW